MDLQELKKKTPSELISQAEKLGIENPSTLRKQEILFSILKKLAEKNEQIPVIISIWIPLLMIGIVSMINLVRINEK